MFRQQPAISVQLQLAQLLFADSTINTGLNTLWKNFANPGFAAR